MELILNHVLRRWPLLAVCLLLLCVPIAGHASDEIGIVSRPSQKLHLNTGKSVVLHTRQTVKRIYIGDPEIVDFVMVSPKEIYITGKRAGTTNMMLWNNDTVSAIYDLAVCYDLSLLKEQLFELMPEEKNLRVNRISDTITLTGTVSSVDKLAQVTALARTFAPEDKVTNLIKVSGGHQVLLEVRVAEISKATTKRLGINFNYVTGDQFGVNLLGGLSELVSPLGANIGATHPDFWLKIPQSVQAILRFESSGTTWTGFIDALQQDGLVKVLAKPTLICLSGQQANFLAGGEFPIPVPQGLGTVAIEYKSFGISLNFKPVVLSDDRINIQVSPEVSELDFSTAIQLSGFAVPGISSRRTSTTIELGDGQSFAIAGLLKDSSRDSVSKFPLLGDIPVLGALFRSREFQKSESELVIIVTPRLVKPMQKDQVVLPTDHYVEPNDSEIFLKGMLQGKQKEAQAPPVVAPESLIGEFGHTMPGQE